MHPNRLRFQIRVQHPARPSQSARHILYSIHGGLGGTDHLDSGSSSSFRARSRIGSVPASRWFCASNGSKTTSRACIWCADSLCSVRRFNMAAGGCKLQLSSSLSHRTTLDATTNEPGRSLAKNSPKSATSYAWDVMAAMWSSSQTACVLSTSVRGRSSR